MKKLILFGRSESGKTTLIQALQGKQLNYQKTQAVTYSELYIDTPGEYLQKRSLGGALAVYSYEADIIGMVVQATEPYTLFPPGVVSMANREVIGIITQIDEPYADVKMARMWLENAGCKTIFEVSSYTGAGMEALLEYLKGEEQADGGKNAK